MRNPRPTATDFCVVCGRAYAHLHEIFYGKNRQRSMEHGFQVRLCYECHAKVHSDRMQDLYFKMMEQRKYEETHSREEFCKIIGRNYL